MANYLIKNDFYANFNSIGFIIGKLKEELNATEFLPEKVNEVFLIVDEICSNIIKYAYNKDKSALFHFEAILKDDHTLEMKFIDAGAKFNPLEYNKIPDYNVEIEDLPIGGLGIKFVKEVSDGLNYEYTKDNKNQLTVIKKLK